MSSNVLLPLQAHLATPCLPFIPTSSLPTLLSYYFYRLAHPSLDASSRHLIHNILRSLQCTPLRSRDMSALTWIAQHLTDGAQATFLRLEWLRQDIGGRDGLFTGFENGVPLEEQGEETLPLGGEPEEIQLVGRGWPCGCGCGGKVRETKEEEEDRARWARGVDEGIRLALEMEEEERKLDEVADVVRGMVEFVLRESDDEESEGEEAEGEE